jgi:hypothetical protein
MSSPPDLKPTQVWWLAFAALAVAARGVGQFVLVAQRERTRGIEATRFDSRSGVSAVHEVDALCDQLLIALRSSPEVVRSFLTNPEQTIEGLRTAAKAIDAKRALLVGAETTASGLELQRTELSRRRDQASDPVARERFTSALNALAANEAALNHFRATRDRFDAEYASLLVLLQEMTTRVAVARTTDTGDQQLALAQNVQRINAELEAITASLQQVATDVFVEPLAPIGDLAASSGTRVDAPKVS